MSAPVDRKRIREVCTMIAADAETDMREYEGAEFNGHNVSVLFGKQAAAIAALANIVKQLTAIRS